MQLQFTYIDCLIPRLHPGNETATQTAGTWHAYQQVYRHKLDLVAVRTTPDKAYILSW